MSGEAHGIRVHLLNILLANRVITQGQHDKALELSEQMGGAPPIRGTRVANGPEGMAWFRRIQGFWALVELESGRELGFITRRGGRIHRFHWRVGEERWNPREAGISLDWYDAAYEVEGGVEVPLEDGVRVPLPEYDPSVIPMGPIFNCRK